MQQPFCQEGNAWQRTGPLHPSARETKTGVAALLKALKPAEILACPSHSAFRSKLLIWQARPSSFLLIRVPKYIYITLEYEITGQLWLCIVKCFLSDCTRQEQQELGSQQHSSTERGAPFHSSPARFRSPKVALPCATFAELLPMGPQKPPQRLHASGTYGETMQGKCLRFTGPIRSALAFKSSLGAPASSPHGCPAMLRLPSSASRKNFSYLSRYGGLSGKR